LWIEFTAAIPLTVPLGIYYYIDIYLKEYIVPLAHAILGFLDYQPMSGYDIKKTIDQSVSHFWSATQSHIYKALENLEKEEMVESLVIQQSRTT
jgi:DNA-binding PadR family transcriptional regulator